MYRDAYNTTYDSLRAEFEYEYKDKIVLTREEYDVLKFNAKHYDPFWFCSYGGCEGVCKECKDTCEMSIFVKERKETAEKILNLIETFCSDNEFIEIVKGVITKEFNVEIKE